MNPQEDIIQPVFDLLADYTNVKSYLGEAELAKNTPKPRYVWVPDLITPKDPEEVGADDDESIADLQIRFGVHCWGGSFDAATSLIGPLMTAVRQQMGGANYTFGPSQIINPAVTEGDWVIVCTLTLRIPSQSALLDQPEYVNTKIRHVALRDGGVDGDGELTTPNVDPAG